MKWYEKIARYFLVVWFLLCVIDGWGQILFDTFIFGKPEDMFLTTLENTMWFWVCLKVFQTLGCLSLLTNYKPALGLALITPISVIMCLYYFFILTDVILIAILIILSTAVLIRAYIESYKPLFKQYPR